VALVGRRSVAERLVIMASAVPIALGTNITRISVTGLLHATGHEVLAGQFLHDLAGWLMMPCALVVLQCELYYLKHLLLVDDDAPVTVGMNSGFPGTAPPRVDDLATVA
jgi:exosortase/archaeosortase family protein